MWSATLGTQHLLSLISVRFWYSTLHSYRCHLALKLVTSSMAITGLRVKMQLSELLCPLRLGARRSLHWWWCWKWSRWMSWCSCPKCSSPTRPGQQARQVGWALCCAPLLRFGRRRQEAAHTHVVAKSSATSSDDFWYHDSLGLAPAGVLWLSGLFDLWREYAPIFKLIFCIAHVVCVGRSHLSMAEI